MAEVERDADTGEEIIYFIRREKPYLYLRNAITKRFIKRLYAIEKRYYMVVNYSKEEARKGNPLYIDTGIYTQLTPEEFKHREEINQKMEIALTKRIALMFGGAVATQLLEDAGIEYGSKPYYKTKAKENKATSLTVWKHAPEQKPKTAEYPEEI